MLHNSLFVFDIETIPDTDAVKNLTGSETKDVETLRKELEEYHIEISGGNPFPRQPFHKIVAISFLEAEISVNNDGTEEYHLTEIRSGGNEDSNEEEIVKGFFSYVAKKRPRFVSYNGRTFDLPVLKYRAMKYGVSAPWFYKSGDKWNNYTQRYSLDWHCDLLDAFSDFGASAKCKMNEVCSILGIPGKFGVDGSKVTELYDSKKIKEIRDYCETDVANTYLLYLFYQMHTGTLSTQGFVNAAEQVATYLEEEGKNKDKKHLADFLAEWKKVDQRFF
jgi:predicted PolB exonuclease-like 3'-5' exonuclease